MPKEIKSAAESEKVLTAEEALKISETEGVVFELKSVLSKIKDAAKKGKREYKIFDISPNAQRELIELRYQVAYDSEFEVTVISWK